MPEQTEEQEKLRVELEAAVQERAKLFPKVDVAMRACENASKAMDTFVSDLRSAAKDLPWMGKDAAAKVKDWAENLIPGVQATKEMLDWFRINMMGSLKYSAPPYQPTSFEEVKRIMIAFAGMEKAAKELKRDEILREHQSTVAKAEESLRRSLDGLSLANQLELAEIQQKIFELRKKISG